MSADSARQAVEEFLRERGEAKNSDLLRLCGRDPNLLRAIRTELIDDGVARDKSGTTLVFTGSGDDTRGGCRVAAPVGTKIREAQVIDTARRTDLFAPEDIPNSASVGAPVKPAPEPDDEFGEADLDDSLEPLRSVMCWVEGSRSGPHDAEAVGRLVAAGRVRRRDLVMDLDTDEWIPARLAEHRFNTRWEWSVPTTLNPESAPDELNELPELEQTTSELDTIPDTDTQDSYSWDSDVDGADAVPEHTLIETPVAVPVQSSTLPNPMDAVDQVVGTVTRFLGAHQWIIASAIAVFALWSLRTAIQPSAVNQAIERMSQVARELPDMRQQNVSAREWSVYTKQLERDVAGWTPKIEKQVDADYDPVAQEVLQMIRSVPLLLREAPGGESGFEQDLRSRLEYIGRLRSGEQEQMWQSRKSFGALKPPPGASGTGPPDMDELEDEGFLMSEEHGAEEPEDFENR